jgi:cytoskeleton protein RodZ
MFMTTFLNTESATPQTLPHPVKPSFSSHPIPFGQQLRQARQKLNLTIEEIAERMKLDPRQLTALEEERFKDLPGGTFIRGFTRQYARILKIDEASLLEQLPSITTHLNSTAHHLGVLPKSKGLNRNRYHKTIVLIALGAALIGLIYALSLLLKHPFYPPKISSSKSNTYTEASNEMARPAPQESVPINTEKESKNPVSITSAAPLTLAQSATSLNTPTTIPSSPSTALLQEPSRITIKASAHIPPRLELSFDEPSWVEIKDANGRILLSQKNAPGTRQSVMGTPPYSLAISHWHGVSVHFKDTAVDISHYAKSDTAHLILE